MRSDLRVADVVTRDDGADRAEHVERLAARGSLPVVGIGSRELGRLRLAFASTLINSDELPSARTRLNTRFVLNLFVALLASRLSAYRDSADTAQGIAVVSFGWGLVGVARLL